MKKGFVIGQSNELIKAEKVYDLHNLYDFVGIILKGKDRCLQMLFEPNPEHGKGSLSVLLVFEKIDYLEFSPNFGAQVICGLDEMGYKNPEDRDDEWLMGEQHATPNDHLFFRLDGGNFIRVHCKNADIFESTKLISI
jgi:hypothetical protein